MTEQEYLDMHGVSSPMSNYMLDKMKLAHNHTERKQKKFEREAHEAAVAHSEKRAQVRKEYWEKVASGEIVQPTLLEQSERIAQGHPDNESVQAARRCVEKRKARLREKAHQQN